MPTETLTKHPDPALFLDFLDPNLSLLDLADRHQLALDDLLDWSEHPDTHQRLTRLHTLISFRNSYLAAEKLPIALTSLTAAATQTAPPNADPALAHRTTESARRAATQLARLASLAPSRALSRATDHSALRTVGEPAAITPSQPTPSDPSTHAPSGALEVPALGHIDAPPEPAASIISKNPGTAVPGFSPADPRECIDEAPEAPVQAIETRGPFQASDPSDSPTEPATEPARTPDARPVIPHAHPHPLPSPIFAATPPTRAAAHHAWP